MKPTRTRNPSGVVKVKPIALRLQPEERAQAERLAKESGHSASALARKAYLKGIPLVAEELNLLLRRKAPSAETATASCAREERRSCNTDRTSKP